MNITFSIFPKFFRGLSLDGLVELVRSSGLDTTNLVIRDGYWCEPAKLASDVPRFVRHMSEAGLKVRFATACYSLADIARDPSPLQILADNGIEEFRLSYFEMKQGDVRLALDDARRTTERIAAICERHRIRAIYQVHHTMLISSATAAYDLVRGLPASAVGIELDPGNQSFEGHEETRKSVSLLGEYLRAFGIKDTRVIRDEARRAEPDKGWTRDWCGLPDGVVNWHEVVRPLVASDWSGTFVFMPFYHEHEPAAQARVLKDEVAYLRRVLAVEMAARKS
ncbi:MAG TPA: sugar phosphate isomerase/epimerase [Opitutaceae bacterium]|nr:sugar phosphate isomerase/epimerase [Opitutaceae bacterium]